MPLSFSLPGRYAKALLEYESLDNDFKSIIAVIHQDVTVSSILNSSFIKKSYLDSFLSIFTVKLNLSKPFISFLSVLVKNRRLNLIEDIYLCYKTLWNKKHNLKPVTVKTAKEPSAAEIARIELLLKKYFTENLITTYEVDLSILGGILIESDNYRIDASLDQQIKALGRILRS